MKTKTYLLFGDNSIRIDEKIRNKDAKKLGQLDFEKLNKKGIKELYVKTFGNNTTKDESKVYEDFIDYKLASWGIKIYRVYRKENISISIGKYNNYCISVKLKGLPLDERKTFMLKSGDIAINLYNVAINLKIQAIRNWASIEGLEGLVFGIDSDNILRIIKKESRSYSLGIVERLT